jgi:hypothetical protein
MELYRKTPLMEFRYHMRGEDIFRMFMMLPVQEKRVFIDRMHDYRNRLNFTYQESERAANVEVSKLMKRIMDDK